MPETTERPCRRRFLKTSASAGVAALAAPLAASAGRATPDVLATRLARYAVPRNTIERFLDPDARVWARFHPTYGYLLRDAFLRDGVDGARTLGRYEATGHRRQVNFRDQPCRIHTYGDSFTQGHQVSDGETWQEVLAAHYCEPIRNFGVGGFGVYQAYRRLVEIESTADGAKHLVLNIWGDDHHRSVYAWRWLSFTPEFLPTLSGVMFHANPWVHARLDPVARVLVEEPNACPSSESLYQLCDAEWIVDRFGGDPITHLLVAIQTGVVVRRDLLDELAAASGFAAPNLSESNRVRATSRRLLNAYAVRVGIEIVKAANRFAASRGKTLFVLLSHPAGSVWRHCAGKPRSGKSGDDAGGVDWHPESFQAELREAGIPFFDTVRAHVADFRAFRGSPKEYVDRYFIGHYSPRGNHFFAHAVKDPLASVLDPAPPAYAESGAETLIRFKGYLPE